MNLQFERTTSVDVTHDDGVLYVTIQRPEKRNALALGVLEEIREVFTRYAGDSAIRLAVLRASGNQAFASGGDVSELAQFRTAEEARAFSLHGKSALDAIRYFPVPVVARINGVALGGGAELALACDMRIATPSAKFGFIHGRLNIAPSWGGGVDLVRLIGPAKALALMASAEVVDARTAVSMGIMNSCADSDEDFDATFDAFLKTMSARPPQVMRAFKSLLINDRKRDRAAADQEETAHFATVWAHDDHWSAVSNLGKKSS